MLASLIRRAAIFCLAVALAMSLAFADGPSKTSKQQASNTTKPDDAALRESGRRLGLTPDELDSLFGEGADEPTLLAAGRALAKLSREGA